MFFKVANLPLVINSLKQTPHSEEIIRKLFLTTVLFQNMFLINISCFNATVLDWENGGEMGCTRSGGFTNPRR